MWRTGPIGGKDDRVQQRRLKLAGDRCAGSRQCSAGKLRQEGVRDNHKRASALSPGKPRGAQTAAEALRVRLFMIGPEASAPNEHCAIDFMRDTRPGGRAFRTLKLLDVYAREGLAVQTNGSLPANRVDLHLK